MIYSREQLIDTFSELQSETSLFRMLTKIQDPYSICWIKDRDEEILISRYGEDRYLATRIIHIGYDFFLSPCKSPIDDLYRQSVMLTSSQIKSFLPGIDNSRDLDILSERAIEGCYYYDYVNNKHFLIKVQGVDIKDQPWYRITEVIVSEEEILDIQRPNKLIQ